MKTALKWIVLAPVVAILLVFALTNRQNVALILDPFGGSTALTFNQPLFVFLGFAAMVGVAFGGLATWLSQSRHRREVRRSRSEIQRLRAENERLAAVAHAKPVSIAAPRNAA
jgi:uncharacterized integral membrane protein